MNREENQIVQNIEHNKTNKFGVNLPASKNQENNSINETVINYEEDTIAQSEIQVSEETLEIEQDEDDNVIGLDQRDEVQKF